MEWVLEAERHVRQQEGLNLEGPGLHEVLLLNDDFTPLAFVVESLERFFCLAKEAAQKIALEAHTKGSALCGVYSREIAETRIDQAIEHASLHDHPLRWKVEAL